MARTLERPSLLATVTAGYGDGYRRSLGVGGHVLVHGRSAPIIALLSMNSMVVDVTDIPAVVPGDEVVLFGGQGGAAITQQWRLLNSAPARSRSG